MVKPSLRTKSIGTKVTEEEDAKLERTAQAGGKTLGEWCREVMLASANALSPKGQLSDGSEAHVLMAEFMALRTILLNVLFKEANGETLTAEQMQTLIDRADAGKLKKAAERLRQGSSGRWAVSPESTNRMPENPSARGNESGNRKTVPECSTGVPGFPECFLTL